MNLIITPQIMFDQIPYLSDFMFVLIVYFILLNVFMFSDIELIKEVRYLCNNIIVSMNNKYFHDTHLLWYVMFVCYTLAFLSFLGHLGFANVFGNPIITILISCFIFILGLCIAIYEIGIIKFIQHMIPNGIPAMLQPILFILELISNIILKPIVISIGIILINSISHLILHILFLIIPNQFAQIILVVFIAVELAKNPIFIYVTTNKFITPIANFIHHH